VLFDKATECLGDRGYQGLQKLHANSRTPKKKPPRKTLSKAERLVNREAVCKCLYETTSGTVRGA
jgi:hypothetical protein